MGTTQIAMKSRGSLGNTLETYSSKLENLEEMNKFLAAVHQPKLSREDIKHLHWSITSNDIEAIIIKSFTTNEDLIDSELNSTWTLDKN
jgi:hypothetical protein